VVLYIINVIVDWIGANMGGGPFIEIIKYILGAIVLIGLLIAAANLLFGVKIGNFPQVRSEIPIVYSIG
jgi:hypothetical protein